MPRTEEHKRITKERRETNKFDSLHDWMDEGQKYLGMNHRFERHSTAYLPYVEKIWKEEGMIEFLLHIIEDYKATLSKYTGKCFICGKPIFKSKYIWDGVIKKQLESFCEECFKKYNPERYEKHKKAEEVEKKI